jgi:hypothetical protein
VAARANASDGDVRMRGGGGEPRAHAPSDCAEGDMETDEAEGVYGAWGDAEEREGDERGGKGDDVGEKVGEDAMV